MTPSLLTIPLAEYIRDPAPEASLSASLAHLLVTRSAQHCWQASPRLNPAWQPDDSEQTDRGTIAHSLLLEGDRSRLVVVDAPDFRTKAAREARDQARAEGKLPVLADRLGQIETMVEIARDRIAHSEVADAFRDGEPERTLLWQEGPTWLRSRPDWMSSDRRVLLDLKFTDSSAEPDSWARSQMLAHGSDLQAALALRGIQAVAKPRDCAFIFVVVETEPPYAVSFVGLSPAYLAFANQKLDHAIRLWGHCVETGEWPSYPSRVAWVEPPDYLTYAWGLKHTTAATVPLDDGRSIAEQLFGEAT